MSANIHSMEEERKKRRTRNVTDMSPDVKSMKETFYGHSHKDKGDTVYPEGGNHMDEATKTILERLDKDIRDHKQEVRERDAKIIADAQEREQRYREEAKEREERMLHIVQEMKSDMKDLKAEMKSDLQSFKTEMKSDIQDIKEECRSTRNTVLVLTLSVILGVAAMVLAIVFAK